MVTVDHWFAGLYQCTPVLLTLPVRRKAELQENSQQILERRPDLAETVFPILMQRHPNFTLEQLMVYVKIPTHELRHSRAAQELIEEGRQEGETRGEARGEVKVTLRQLARRCGPLSEATTARIQALSSDIRFWSSGDTKTGPPDRLLMGA
ncbi:MAG: DUF4351 domain-containing protein [Cyanobium sp.]